VSSRLGNIAAELSAGRAPRPASSATSDTGSNGATKPPKANGRPKRTPYVKMHFTIDADLARYVNEAWRMHRLEDGGFVNGPSAFVEDIVRRFRAGEDADRASK